MNYDPFQKQTRPLKIIFAGTPEFGLPCLEALYASHHQLIAIYTQPDRPAGRGQKLHESAIKIWGLQHSIPIYQPINFKNPEAIEALQALEPDLMIVIAYGLILPKQVLTIPRLGCINVHASILPYWRGAAPIQQAILSGDVETGVSIMQMDMGMDTGPVYTVRKCAINAEDTAGSLHHKLSALAPVPLLETIDSLQQKTAHAIAQVEPATYAPKIQKQDALINWQQPAAVIDRQIRAYYPWPIAFTQFQEGVIRIHKAKFISYSGSDTPGTIISMTAEGMLIAAEKDAILIQNIQFPGGKPISIADYLNSQRKDLKVGIVLK